MATTPQQRPGATIYSVAALAGVSIASVSRVLQGSTAVSDRTRVKVLAAAEQLNYVPLGAARSLAVRHHEAHGLVLPELTGPYYSELLMGFESRAAELGQSVVLMLAGGKADLPRAVRQLAARVDGLAMLGSAAIPESAVRALQGSKPLLLIAGDPRRGRRGDQRGEHRERPCPDAAPARPRPPPAALRRRPRLRPRHPRPLPRVRAGPREPARRAPRPSRCASPSARPTAPGSPSASSPARSDADALVCANDELALSIMARLQEGGRDVPGDIAVVGWDDVMTARYVRPGLTTVRQPVRELGAMAADRLHELVTGASPTTGSRSCPPQLVLRASCGCPPAATALADRPEHLRPAHRLNPTHRPCPRRPVSPPEGEPR